MRIYVAHPTGMDYQNEIYAPIMADAFFSDFEVVLPHAESRDATNTREDYKKFDLVIAECSEPSLGVGIELGWCYDDGKPIYCFYKTGKRPSGAVYTMANKVIEYADAKDFVEKVKGCVREICMDAETFEEGYRGLPSKMAERQRERDPFWSEANQARLRESMEEMERTGGVPHSVEELYDYMDK